MENLKIEHPNDVSNNDKFYRIYKKIIAKINDLISTTENLDIPDITGLEETSNKVTSISGTSTNTQYPSAKLLYDQLALKQNASTVKVYRALLSQSGTSAPTAIVLENTLGETPTFSRVTFGTYFINTVEEIFTENKTIILNGRAVVSGPGGNTCFSLMYWQATSLCSISTILASNSVATDGALDSHYIEIMVYP